MAFERLCACIAAITLYSPNKILQHTKVAMQFRLGKGDRA